MRKLSFALSALSIVMLIGCNDDTSSTNNAKPTTNNGVSTNTQLAHTTELDKKLFKQIKKASEHKTPWLGYDFKSVPIYLIHSKNKQSQNAYIFNPIKQYSGSRTVNETESNGLKIDQYNDGAVSAHDKLLAGNGMFEFYYKIDADTYYLQTYTEQQVNVDHLLTTPSITLAYHEAFHNYQAKNFKQPAHYSQLDFEKLSEYPLSQDMLTLKLMVLDMFKGLPDAKLTKSEVKDLIQNYVILVDEMLRIDNSRIDGIKTGWVYKHALGQELYEGSAMMIDTLMSREVLSAMKEKRFNIYDPLKLDETQYDFTKIQNKKSMVDYFAFEMFYDSGSAIIWLLLQDGVDYKEFESGQYPYDIAKKAIKLNEHDAFYALQALKNSDNWEKASQAAKRYLSFK